MKTKPTQRVCVFSRLLVQTQMNSLQIKSHVQLQLSLWLLIEMVKRALRIQQHEQTQRAHSKAAVMINSSSSTRWHWKTADIQRWLIHVQLVYTSFYIKKHLADSKQLIITAENSTFDISIIKMSEGSIALHIYRHPTSIQPLKKTFPLQNILNKTHYLNKTDSEIH